MARMQNRDRLLRKMAALPGHVRSALRQALAESADEITDMQRRLAPVKDGHLRNSIGSTFGTHTPDNPNVRGVTAAAGPADPDLTVVIHAGDEKAFYAAFVEFGTQAHEQPNNPRIGYQHPGATAQPFFYPAYRALKKRVKSRLTKAAKQAAHKVARQ
jgi:HK97 gp10 family phage protein